MAISVGSSNGGRRSRGAPPLAEINVTPFVDVALVLLIIFMLTAHIVEYGMDIDVPKTKSVASTTQDTTVIVQVTKTGDIYLGKNAINIHRLVDQIHAQYPGQNSVFLRASGQTPWDIIANIMSVLGEAKFAVKAVTQLDERKPGR